MSETTTASPRAVSMTRRQAATVAALAVAQLMLVLDVTVVNVALPQIGTELNLGRTALTWVMTIYTTLFGGLVLLGGKAADLFGARRVLVTGLVLFTVSSLLCALADDAVTLLAGRAAQGIGAALLSPAALTVLLAHVDGQARSRALAVWGALSAVGTALGVSVGGLLTASLGWEWVFAINVPIGVVLLVVLPILTGRVAGTSARPDVPGALLVTAGTALIVYGLVNAGSAGWTAPATLAPLVTGALLWVVLPAVERRAAEPMLRISLLTERPVAAGSVLMVVATGLMVGNFFLGSFALQRAYGDGALAVGLEFLPVAVAVGVGAQLAGRVLQVVAARWVATLGLALAAVGEATAALGQGRAALIGGLAVAAFGIGAVFVTAFTAGLATAGATDRGLRSAVISTAHELGGAFGIALLSSIAGAALAADLPQPEDFSSTFWAAAVVAALTAALAPVFVPAVRKEATPVHH
ncbi:MFS transporter [Myceligenerans xiligouense]|uniref:EmrB/QacA subfamily drug resistance transporter n=1 Tax=Myceligenerans xiligouense TaxID=253184 RepID=A0A3N4YI26_9MICO|nr:MFS transporter [Myceligenerans xiligouense]RPF20423.1 EmrB/QacA subfamily drug resistance transporter [Myceligenerans xiligouense]